MKPHRRKKSPPRRPAEQGTSGSSPAPHESAPVEGSDAGTQEVASGGSGDEAPPVPAPETPDYDPGQALVDFGESAGDVPPVDSEQAHVDPATYSDSQFVDAGSYPAPDGGAAPQDVTPPPPAFGVYDDAPSSPPPPVSAPAPQLNAPAAGGPVRKKVARRGPQRRPATPRSRSGSGYRPPRPTYGGGISMMDVFMVIVAIGMLVLAIFVALPKELSGVEGYPANILTAEESRNLLDEAQRVMINREGELSFSEEEVNLYLNQRLQVEQGGAVSSFVKFRGVYVDFSPGHAEIVIERELFGFPVTMSSRVRTETFRQQVQFRPAGWSIGRINLSTRNIKPVMDLFFRMRATCQEEYQVLQQMAEVRFEENRIVLDPRI